MKSSSRVAKTVILTIEKTCLLQDGAKTVVIVRIGRVVVVRVGHAIVAAIDAVRAAIV